MGIELRNITRTFEDVTALNGVNLTVYDGEFLTLLGPSGCGKTTLLRIVAGFIRPDEGQVLIDGQEIDQVPPSRRPTGMVFQSYALFPHMTVRDNISFGLRMRGAPGSEIDEKVNEMAGLLGISNLLDRYPGQLSGGQQQRVSVARTLAVEPAALLMDEPLAALDRKLRVEMRTELRKLVDKVGITTIFVTHDQEEALTMSDRVAVMNKGKLIQRGTPVEIYDDPQSRFVASFIGASNLLPGEIAWAQDRRPVFEGEGIHLPLPSTFKSRVGERVNLLLRPEHLEVEPIDEQDDPEGSGVLGTVQLVTHLGMSIEYEIKLDEGAQLLAKVVRSRDESPISEGTRVLVRPVDEASYLTLGSEGDEKESQSDHTP